MKTRVTIGLCLMLGLSLVAGCNGGVQSLSPPSASQNTAVNTMNAASGQHQLAAAHLPVRHVGYIVTDLGTLGGTFSFPLDVSNNGAVSGSSLLAGDAVQHGFLWYKGRMRDLGTLPAGPNVGAIAVNNRLQVVGVADGASTPHDGNACYCTDDGNSSLNCHSFLWQGGRMTDTGTLGGNSSIAEWINNRGQIVGISEIKATTAGRSVPCAGSPGGQVNRAYLFENGRFKDLGTLGGCCAGATSIDDAGQIAGASDVSTTIDPQLGFVPIHAYRLANGVMTDLGTLGGGASVAFALNNEGDVIGYSTLAGEQHMHAFRWQDGVMSDLGVLDGDTDSAAFGLNSRSQVVGFSATNSTSRAFIKQDGVMTDLNTLISPTSGFQLAVGWWINEAGQIAAQALVERTGEMHAVLLTASDHDIHGKTGGVPLTASLRDSLLHKYGLSRHAAFLSPRY